MKMPAVRSLQPSYNLLIYQHLMELVLFQCLPALSDCLNWWNQNPFVYFFSDHLRSIKSNLPGRPVVAHFNSSGHTIEHAKTTVILSTCGYCDKDRHSTEQRIISKLQTLHPHGINIRFDVLRES